ncbi:galactosylgalactosylxylosylprotein 3-beta-glucuronosyltransferase P-like [Amblyomma americanum]
MLARVRIFWIVIEDADKPSGLVSGIISRSGLPCAHLVARTPEKYREVFKGKGVTQRMRALAWLRANGTLPAVLYFADDDNAYDHRIFSQISRIRRIGVFPVGLVGRTYLSSPVVSRKGVVVGFYDSWLPEYRRYALDMAGFAVNLELVLLARNPRMPHKKGMLETGFIGSLGTDNIDWELLAGNCTEVLVWHTKTRRGNFPEMKISANELFVGTNIPILYKNILGNSMQ